MQSVEHFKDLLLQWKQELMEEVDRTMHHMQEDAANYADPSDRATQERESSAWNCAPAIVSAN